ncbi:hypothetical protein DdX_19776 [Ditylenchus destructor]|uniref:Uncharacterized protein n=1 Tax=Ditylenchus destructor TaxID=166010 RepID=A0AAD4MHU5_9BILA|nr:hypothetical protein DdX_19776 [Ditylenchus destructor]
MVANGFREKLCCTGLLIALQAAVFETQPFLKLSSPSKAHSVCAPGTEIFAAPLGSGRVIRQSLRLGETRRLVPVSPTKIDSEDLWLPEYPGWPWAPPSGEAAGWSYGIKTKALGSGRVIRQSLRLGETRRLVPLSREDLRFPGFMASGNPENPGFGAWSTA